MLSYSLHPACRAPSSALVSPGFQHSGACLSLVLKGWGGWGTMRRLLLLSLRLGDYT